MSARAETISAQSPARPWLYDPWMDLVVGCGAWSAPLLAITWLARSNTHGWTVAFYALAIVFNYPHFMATVYRAYHTRENFEKYKILTLHVTLLMVVTGVLLHAWPRLLPWVFTLYICWSPWHYTGQNYGLLMMFARRSGAEVSSAERRWIRAAFIASYLMLLASFETASSGQPLVLSLGLPAKFTLWARLALGAAFALFAVLGFRRLVARGGWEAMTPSMLLAFTQFLWFVLPTLLELRATYQIPQTQYSSGILAVLHSAQYIWVTSYYQQREARAAGQSKWRVAAYFVTLVAGGIALFIPGPWLVSYILRFDFTTSLLIFTALVNIHHFILDGAVWKLRDSRVASLLIGPGSRATGEGASLRQTSGQTVVATSSFVSRLIAAPMIRIGLAGLLLVWGAVEEVRYALGTDDSNLSALVHASRMNPYDSTVEARIAVAEGQAGKRDEAIDALMRAVAINPHNVALQNACAKALLELGRYQDAYDHYAKMLKLFPRDEDALVNYGLLAARLGHAQEALDSWQKAAEVDPDQPNPHLYLAHAYDLKGDPTTGAREWQEYLRTAALRPDDPVARLQQQASAAVQLGDDETKIDRNDLALQQYQAAVDLAGRSGDLKLQSLALAHLGDSQEKSGDAKSAAQSYQRGLQLDAKANDPRGEAIDWFSYGQFLQRHRQSNALVYACMLRSEELLKKTNSPELSTVQAARHELESRLGAGARLSQTKLPQLLATAGSLPATSF
ncbi:MAG TPA: tetratricopeptide repeat protein [Candidatus Acidoferrales bacterium]|nr:tetratricopeptide repeat protein [Candidatus Acidoferrales bacterium]